VELSEYLVAMVEKQASDLFISVGAPPMVNVEGKMSALDNNVVDEESARALIHSVLNDEQRKTFQTDLELNMALQVPNAGRFRVNLFHQRGAPAAVCRYIKDQIPSVSQLGLPQKLHEIIMGERGLVLVVGGTGTGKSTIARRLCEATGMVQLRSDTERKRMAGLAATERSTSGTGKGLYTAEQTAKTYQRLTELATLVLQAGYAVIVDATFLQRQYRDLFRALADQNRVPFVILECQAADAEIERRIKVREARGGDPSEATLEVLQAQRAAGQALATEEIPYSIGVNSGIGDIGPVLGELRERLNAAGTDRPMEGYF